MDDKANPWRHNGMDMLNFRAYFDTDYTYVEEFDTEDGEHWMGRTKPENWTPEILKLAMENNIIPN